MKEERIFHEALERPADQRAAYLDDACGDDRALRQRVEVLLRAHANPGSFLSTPAAALFPSIGHPPTEQPSSRRLLWVRMVRVNGHSPNMVWARLKR